MAANRIGMMYHRGVDDFSIDLSKAEELYTRAIGRGGSSSEEQSMSKINAIYNMGVLLGQRRHDRESTERSVQLFKDAIGEVEKLEIDESSYDLPPDKHSTSFNNFAVITEAGELVRQDIETAKKLYLRAVEIDENPMQFTILLFS